MLRRSTEHLDEVEKIFSPIVDAFREAVQEQEKAA
jgi:flagellin-specific chaperone FliS